MALAWSVVELQSNLGTPRLAQVLHRRALRDVLTNETIRVLVRAPLPGVVRRSKIEGDPGGALDLPVAVELGAVVDRDGLKMCRCERINWMTRRLVAATERERSFPIRTQPVTRSTRVTTQCRSTGLTTVSISQWPIS